jgi:hypothetical protein
MKAHNKTKMGKIKIEQPSHKESVNEDSQREKSSRRKKPKKVGTDPKSELENINKYDKKKQEEMEKLRKEKNKKPTFTIKIKKTEK